MHLDSPGNLKCLSMLTYDMTIPNEASTRSKSKATLIRIRLSLWKVTYRISTYSQPQIVILIRLPFREVSALLKIPGTHASSPRSGIAMPKGSHLAR